MDEVEEAIEQVDRIIELIDEEVPEWALDKATEFFEDVREKVSSVGKTIARTQRVSDKQKAALDGWEEGVRKWIKDS